MCKNKDIAPIIEDSMQEELIVIQEVQADIEKPKKERKPYIMAAACKSAFKRMKQLRAESFTSKRTLKEKDEEKKNVEERISTPHPSPQPSPSPARVKKERKNVHLKNARQLLQRNYLHKLHLISSRGYNFFLFIILCKYVDR